MVDSVERISKALAALASEPNGLSVVDFSRKMQTGKASGSHLLSLLSDSGLAERDPVTQQYFLGIRVFTFGAAALTSLHLIEFAVVPLAQTARLLGLPVSICVQRGDKIVTLLRTESLDEQGVYVRAVGDETPVEQSATGKIMAAFCPDKSAEQRAFAGDGRLEAQQIRRVGYARRDREWGYSIAVPIFNYTKQPIATITSQWRDDRPIDVAEARIVAELKEICRNLSRLLGYVSFSDTAFA